MHSHKERHVSKMQEDRNDEEALSSFDSFAAIFPPALTRRAAPPRAICLIYAAQR